MFKNHPRGLSVLFFTEMWERFGFYLLLGIFMLYMQKPPEEGSPFGGLGLDVPFSNEIYGTFMALVYLTPFFGGLLADQYIGCRKSIVIGGLLMAAGYLGVGMGGLLTSQGILEGGGGPAMGTFYISLLLIIVGNGFFKPNISTIVGRLYREGSPHKDAGYNIFYMGINIGAFACNFAAAILRNRIGWWAAFTAAGIGMLIGLVTFLLGQRHLVGVKDRGDAAAVQKGILQKVTIEVFIPAAIAGGIGWAIASRMDLGHFLTPVNTAFFAAVAVVVAYYVRLLVTAPRDERGPLGALLAIFLVVIVFWMVFHQNGNTLTMWARDHTNREAGPAWSQVLRTVYMDEVAGKEYWENADPAARPPDPEAKVGLFSTELFQAINPFFIVVLTPVLVAFFAWLRRYGKEPSTPAKLAWGLFIEAITCVIMLAAVYFAAGGKTSWLWLLATYTVISVGELCLSPMGLALVSKLSPARVTAIMMGGWFLATAVGNKLAGVIGGLWDRIPTWGIFTINLAGALLAAIAIALMVPWIRRVMDEHAKRAR